jgi:hypothetical protein
LYLRPSAVGSDAVIENKEIQDQAKRPLSGCGLAIVVVVLDIVLDIELGRWTCGRGADELPSAALPYYDFQDRCDRVPREGRQRSQEVKCILLILLAE